MVLPYRIMVGYSDHLGLGSWVLFKSWHNNNKQKLYDNTK